ncbi:MAG: bifunctional nuclease family protein [Acidimicrobiales bacterium]
MPGAEPSARAEGAIGEERDGQEGGGPGAEEEVQELGDQEVVYLATEVAGISMELPNAYPTLVLRELSGARRRLLVPVGLQEGIAIGYALRQMHPPRPFTHDLFTTVAGHFELNLSQVRIVAVKGYTFYAELDVSGPNGSAVFSCRPSDAVSLALRQAGHVPVLVAEWVLDQCAIPAEL